MIVLSLLKAGRGKPNIWIEAGIHAREWIAPAMAIYIIDQLLNNDKDGFLSKLNFHILPCANPDGYEFSRMPKEDGGVSNNVNRMEAYFSNYRYLFDKISIYRIDCGEKIVQSMVALILSA